MTTWGTTTKGSADNQARRCVQDLMAQTSLTEHELGVTTTIVTEDVMLHEVADVLDRILEPHIYQRLVADPEKFDEVSRYIRLQAFDYDFFMQTIYPNEACVQAMRYVEKYIDAEKGGRLHVILCSPLSPNYGMLRETVQVYLPVRAIFNTFAAPGQWVTGMQFYNNYCEQYGFSLPALMPVTRDTASQDAGVVPVPLEMRDMMPYLLRTVGILLGIL